MNETVSEKRSRNLDLILRARTEDAAEAMDALGILVEENAGLVRSIALRFRDRGVDLEDLVQIGTIGMIKAVRTFAPEREVAFSTYAVPLITGEIKRHLRDEGPIKISRVYKKLSTELCYRRSKILAEEGREPSVSELAELCGISAEDAAIALESQNPISSLSETCGDDEKLTLETRLASPDCEIERTRDRVALAQAIGHLDPQWQRIITLRYFRNMTQQQVASIMGLSQVKISREEKKILARLKNELG